MKRDLAIDIVIPQLAEKGGMDKVINQFVIYLQDESFTVRVVQCVDTGLTWWHPSVHVTSLFSTVDNPNFNDSAIKYADFLKQTYTPDIILASGWPIIITIVSKALKTINSRNTYVFAWPHMMLSEAADAGVGSIDCVKDADAFFAISKLVENEANTGKTNIPIIRINNPIDYPNTCKEINNKSFQRTMNLLYVGRLVDYKNLNLIFKAISTCKHDWTLRVVGSGENEKTMRSCENYGVAEKVIFDGFKDDPWDNIDDIDFCIVSSNYEGFCLVIPEALSHGIPVITTPVGVAPEIIKNGVNGYLFGIKDDKMLAQVLDMIWEGKLPIPDSKVCIESAKPYSLSEVLSDFKNKLLETYNNLCKQ